MPDIYIATYVDWSFDNHIYCPASSGDKRELCSPKEYAGTRDYLFLSSSNGSFNLVDAPWIQPDASLAKGLGVLIADFDQDGDNDIYVANDTTPNFFYVNESTKNSGFIMRESAMLGGVALDERGLPNGSMGLTTCDVNNDLRLDIWVANYERESFAVYRNEGPGIFLHTSRRYGIAALGGFYVGFGTDWEDFDCDGTEEIVVSNGHVLRYPTGAPRQQHPLLLAQQDSRFVVQEFPNSSYFSGVYDGRGLAVGDLNGDGKQDIAISHINENIAILQNETRSQGDYLRVQLVGTQSSRDAVGATVVLETTHGRQIRAIVGGGSYLSHNQREAYFGIPAGAKPQSLTVTWPEGRRQKWTKFESRHLLLVEPN